MRPIGPPAFKATMGKKVPSYHHSTLPSHIIISIMILTMMLLFGVDHGCSLMIDHHNDNDDNGGIGIICAWAIYGSQCNIRIWWWRNAAYWCTRYWSSVCIAPIIIIIMVIYDDDCFPSKTFIGESLTGCTRFRIPMCKLLVLLSIIVAITCFLPRVVQSKSFPLLIEY